MEEIRCAKKRLQLILIIQRPNIGRCICLFQPMGVDVNQGLDSFFAFRLFVANQHSSINTVFNSSSFG
jgi:hypothetical protein